MSKGKSWFLAITAALGGFLFGFDTIVINGAEQDIQKLWNLSGGVHGWVISAALWGTVVGSLAGGWGSDFFGRKRTLFGVGVLFLVSAVWSAFATGPWTMIAARFLGGLGVGVSTIAAPVYIAEIAPAESRGKMTALFQFNIVFGVVVSLASNLLLKDIGANAWRWMLGVEAFPALVFTLLCPFLIESPRWLKANEELRMKNEERGVEREGFWSHSNLRPILLAFFVAFFNQFSGCNAVNYFAPRIFSLAGFERDAQFLATFGLGMLNFAATFTGVWLIDRLGRKTLLLIGGVGYVVSLFAASLFFYLGNGVMSAAMVFLFLAAHAVGQGTVIWVLIAEVFPQKFRAQGQSLGSFTHWFFAALIALTFPLAAESVPAWAIFGFFGVAMVFHLLWAIFIVPETKGKTLDELAYAESRDVNHRTATAPGARTLSPRRVPK